MKKVYVLFAALALSAVAKAQVDVVATAGTLTGTYTTLGAAFNAINAGTHQGVINVTLTASTNEGPTAATLQPSGGSSNYTTVVVRPGAENIVVEGSAPSVIQLKGADSVIIDGNYAGSITTNTDLTVRNTSLQSVDGPNASIWLSSTSGLNASGASRNTIKNCLIYGIDKTESTFGIMSSGATFATSPEEPNNNNVLDSNVIYGVNDGIALIGSLVSQDQGWVVRNNRVGSLTMAQNLGRRGIVATNMNGIHITNNVVFGVVSDNTVTAKGIELSDIIIAGRINGNRIHDIHNTEAVTGAGAAGLYFSTGISASNFEVYNNEVWAITANGDASSWTADNNSYGMVLVSGAGVTMYHNTVNMNINQATPGNSAALFIGPGFDPGGLNLQNNILLNNQTTGTRYSVYNEAPGVFSDVDYNLYYSSDANLNYFGGPVADLDAWKAITLNDTGSVSAPTDMIISGDNLYVDATSANSWNANGKAIAVTAVPTDINGVGRSLTIGIPNDIGSREFTPTQLPPDATSPTAPANGTTQAFYYANRKIAEITWGAGGTVPTSVSMKYHSGILPPLFTAAIKIHSYWDVTAAGGAGYTYTIKYYFTEAENNQASNNLLQIVRDMDGNGNWQDASGNFGIDADGRYIAPSVPLTAFYKFTLGTVPLGLDLLTFTAKKSGGINNLEWLTTSEKNMADYTVMRSADGITFTEIGIVKSRNELMNTTYTFSDVRPIEGYNYYRLKMTEHTGESYFSNIVSVKNNNSNKPEITAVYPNPATDNVNITLTAEKDEDVNITVTNLAGTVVIVKQLTIARGLNTLHLNISELSSGIYMINAALASGEHTIQTFVKQ